MTLLEAVKACGKVGTAVNTVDTLGYLVDCTCTALSTELFTSEVVVRTKIIYVSNPDRVLKN